MLVDIYWSAIITTKGRVCTLRNEQVDAMYGITFDDIALRLYAYKRQLSIFLLCLLHPHDKNSKIFQYSIFSYLR